MATRTIKPNVFADGSGGVQTSNDIQNVIPIGAMLVSNVGGVWADWVNKD